MGDAEMRWALGFMSGTSLDGVDAALLRTDGEHIAEFGPTAYFPMPEEPRAQLQNLMARFGAGEIGVTADQSPDASGWPGLTAANELVGSLHTACLSRLPADAPKPDVAGFHGVTMLHRPEAQITVQIGAPAPVAAYLGAPVIFDMRRADMRAGGQGAPLAPFYHFALARYAGLTEPCAFLNLGGIANVTFVDPMAAAPEYPGTLLAFDTGPANAQLDDFVADRTGAAYDADGRLASLGVADEALVGAWIARSPYLSAPGPKSLDRGHFADIAADLAGRSDEDGAATLAAFSAACVAEAAKQAAAPPSRWLVCGGGRKNPAMMRALSQRLAAPVEPVEEIGVNGDFVEAQAFAYLAMRAARGLPLSAPGTTGCAAPTCAGQRVDAS